MERVMGGEKAGLMATDPPYGVDFAGRKYNPRAKAWAGIENDKRTGRDLQEWLGGILRVWLPWILDDSSFYFWTAAMEEGAAAAAALRECGLHVQAQIIWAKNCLVLGQADYQWKHENCWYAFKKGKKHRWYGGRAQTTVWEVSKLANSEYEHPMQKPVELYARAIRNHTRDGDIVCDPFVGSGSQLIAAQKLNRRCFAIEISEKYIDVAVLRLMRAAPELPVKCSRVEAVKAMKERHENLSAAEE
ncbi:MAG TPA: DNA methyltransferase [Planctomycetota bacterium]|nr:DNA methyltransferase [Planctomycetota bacterium]